MKVDSVTLIQEFLQVGTWHDGTGVTIAGGHSGCWTVWLGCDGEPADKTGILHSINGKPVSYGTYHKHSSETDYELVTIELK